LEGVANKSANLTNNNGGGGGGGGANACVGWFCFKNHTNNRFQVRVNGGVGLFLKFFSPFVTL
jgi:hypothetical protein